MRICWEEIIPGRWFRAVPRGAFFGDGSATGFGWIVPSRWFGGAGLASRRGIFLYAPIVAAVLHAAATSGDLKAVVRAYRASPTPAGRAAVEAYAAAHPSEDSMARFALGVVAYEQKDYAAAVSGLEALPAKLPSIADYVGFYLAASRVELKDFGAVAQDLAAATGGETRSPLAGKAWLVEAQALQSSAPGDAVKALRDHYTQLPQPDGARRWRMRIRPPTIWPTRRNSIGACMCNTR